MSRGNSTGAVAAASNYVRNVLSKFGISRQRSTTTIENQHISDIIDNLLNFRNTVRNRALEISPKDTTLLKECDNVRKSLATCGIVVKVKRYFFAHHVSRDQAKVHLIKFQHIAQLL